MVLTSSRVHRDLTVGGKAGAWPFVCYSTDCLLSPPYRTPWLLEVRYYGGYPVDVDGIGWSTRYFVKAREV